MRSELNDLNNLNNLNNYNIFLCKSERIFIVGTTSKTAVISSAARLHKSPPY
jgi:hypothetical protein